MSFSKILVTTVWLLIPVLLGAQEAIDTKNASISFVFKEKDVDGTIGDIRSESEINSQDFTLSLIKGSVSLESLKTGNFLRDWHLMSKKFFNRNKQDRLYFESTKIEKVGNGYSVTGNLDIKGISKPVTFKTTFRNGKLQLSGAINISDWDIIIEKEASKNRVEISMELPVSKL